MLRVCHELRTSETYTFSIEEEHVASDQTPKLGIPTSDYEIVFENMWASIVHIYTCYPLTMSSD